jgi:hypothetical protein
LRTVSNSLFCAPCAGAIWACLLGWISDFGRKRELGEDVPFHPLPAASEHTPFVSVPPQVMGAITAAGCRLSVIDGLPLPYEGSQSPVFLHDVVTPPAPSVGDAMTTRKGRFVSTALLNQRKCHISQTQIADGEHGAG